MSTTPIPERRTESLSIVVPFLNESAIINLFFEQLMTEVKKLPVKVEIVCVDNCSRDNTFELLVLWRTKHPEIKVMKFSRYFGKEAALSAGIDYATGDAVVLMDPDLQDPPSLLNEFITKWREGNDLVYATRRESGIEGRTKTFANTMFYKVFNFVSETQIPFKTGDFRLIDRRIVDVIRHLREKSRFLRALSAWAGYTSACVMFDRPPRVKGESKSNYGFLWRYALDALLSTTTRPLRIWTYVGLAISGLAMLGALFLFIRALFFFKDVPGYASMMVAILFLGGFQLLSIGIVAEYVGRIYREVQDRPLYVVDQAVGVDATLLPPRHHS